MDNRFGKSGLTAAAYNAMIYYIENGYNVEDCPFYGDMSEYEIGLYGRVKKQYEDEVKKDPDFPVHLATMEKDWDD